MMLAASNTWVVMRGLSLEVRLPCGRFFTWITVSPRAHTEGPGNSGTTGGKFVATGDAAVREGAPKQHWPVTW